ncbi:hypothetical protein FHX37_0531 [Haloactinospora alba]|uniref:Uncharacterized protein n=1 Tax=Haloactinospora alba TaxID=405555 RepID=A0A543NFN6_9ACTN|nr:hypothetical protein [Haloactinospora alba]TQN30649.1 hypothetical protein FHX37_0531 [Haloactinospora alba]
MTERVRSTAAPEPTRPVPASGQARLRLPRRWRSALLSAHVITSVGWLGLHASLVALLALGTARDDPARAADAYSAAGLLVTALVAPVSLASLGTGLVLAVGTPWGVFRYYWVALKLGLTVVLVLGSNLSLGPQVLDLAETARDGALPADIARLRTLVALSVALSVLALTSVLSTVKPFGRTRRARGGPSRRRAPLGGRRS